MEIKHRSFVPFIWKWTLANVLWYPRLKKNNIWNEKGIRSWSWKRISNHRRGKFTSWLFSPFNQPRLRLERDGRRIRAEGRKRGGERKKEGKKEEERFLVTPWELETAAARPPPVAIAACRAAMCSVVSWPCLRTDLYSSPLARHAPIYPHTSPDTD